LTVFYLYWIKNYDAMKIGAIILLTISVIFMDLPSRAQRGYINGYVVTLNDDTIAGKIKDRSSGTFENIYSRIKFKPYKGKKRRFGPDKIKAYAKGEIIYESIWVDTYRQGLQLLPNYRSIAGYGRQQFAKIIYGGYLTYYHLEYADDDLNVDFLPVYKRKDEPVMVRVTQGIFGLKKKLLSEYFNDCPELVKKINSGEFKEPYYIAKFYNQQCFNYGYGP